MSYWVLTRHYVPVLSPKARILINNKYFASWLHRQLKLSEKEVGRIIKDNFYCIASLPCNFAKFLLRTLRDVILCLPCLPGLPVANFELLLSVCTAVGSWSAQCDVGWWAGMGKCSCAWLRGRVPGESCLCFRTRPFSQPASGSQRLPATDICQIK